MDDGSPIGYLLVIFVLIIGGAYFAGAETALASVNRIRMLSNADNGDKNAKRVLYILDHFDKALTTLLIGNNIMHIGCASVATLMATKLWGEGSVGYMTIAVTIVVFLIAEMLPKRFAKACNEKFAMEVAGSLILLMKLLTPISFFFTKLSELVAKPRGDEDDEPTVTEDELYDIIENIGQEGALDEEKTELVKSALEFSDRLASDVMTPWDRVLYVRANEELDSIREKIVTHGISRWPVVNGENNVIGILQIRRFLRAYLRNGRVRLKNAMDDAHFVRADTPIDELLSTMSANKTHISIVLDCEGKTLGIITVEDILEELVGEIYDEDDKILDEDGQNEFKAPLSGVGA